MNLPLGNKSKTVAACNCFPGRPPLWSTCLSAVRRSPGCPALPRLRQSFAVAWVRAGKPCRNGARPNDSPTRIPAKKPCPRPPLPRLSGPVAGRACRCWQSSRAAGWSGRCSFVRLLLSFRRDDRKAEKPITCFKMHFAKHLAGHDPILTARLCSNTRRAPERGSTKIATVTNTRMKISRFKVAATI